MAFGIIETAHSWRQLNRVNVNPRRRTVGLGYKNDVQSFFCLSVIKIDLSQFFFLLYVLVAINLRASRKRQWANGGLNRAIRSNMVDCFLSAWRIHVKNTRQVVDLSQLTPPTQRETRARQ